MRVSTLGISVRLCVGRTFPFLSSIFYPFTHTGHGVRGGGGGGVLWVQRDRLASAATIDVDVNLNVVVDVCAGWHGCRWCLAPHRGRCLSLWCSIRIRKQGSYASCRRWAMDRPTSR